MRLVAVAVAAVAVVAPVLGFFALSSRSLRYRPKRLLLGAAFLLGLVAFVPTSLLETLLAEWADIDRAPGAKIDAASLVYVFLVVAPLEQAIKVLAIVPVWRSRRFDEPLDGIVFAAAVALGFVTAHNALLLGSRDPLSLDLARALLSVPAHLFFAACWGYALGRSRTKRLTGRFFLASWVVAAAFHGLYEHLVYQRPPGALIAILPVLLCMGVLTFAAARDLVRRDFAPRRSGRSLLPSIAPPSLRAMQEALRRADEPVMIGWIAFGALVTFGAVLVAVGGAVALGHRWEIDFAAVDRQESGAAAPLALLGGAALLAFPVAGYLVARASSTKTVLEPAAAATLSIAAVLLLLGLAAPASIVFALAFAPLAFGLACAGAWFGIAR